MWTSSHLLVFFLFCGSLLSLANSITIKVDPKTEECFYEDLESGDEVTWSWAVVDGGLLDIEISVLFLDVTRNCRRVHVPRVG